MRVGKVASCGECAVVMWVWCRGWLLSASSTCRCRLTGKVAAEVEVKYLAVRAKGHGLGCPGCRYGNMGGVVGE